MSNRVGPYEVVRLLKGGGQGQVFLGYDRRLSRDVAIKIYDLPKDRAQQRRLMDRARLVASIQSPRVVQVHDVIASGEHLALVMEYVPGCDLEIALDNGRPGLSVALSIAAQVASAIAAARQRRVVHGDIKPANLLLNHAGQVKLTDFGIARPVGESAAGEGSLVCLAPEQARGEAVDSRTDLFALGCLLYRMLSGRQPFWSSEGLDIDALLYREPVPILALWDGDETLPQGLADLVGKLLQKNPDDRPANTHVVRQALRDIAAQLPAAAGNPVADFARELLGTQVVQEAPLALPPGLRSRHSILDSGPLSRLMASHWRFAGPGQRWLLVSLLATLLTAVSLVAHRLWRAPEPLLLQAPLIHSAALKHSPVSADWLAAELEAALLERLGEARVRVSETVKPRPVLYREGREPVEETLRNRLRLRLDCEPAACLLELQLDRGRERTRAQGLVLAGQAHAAWRLEIEYLLDSLLSPATVPDGRVAWSGGEMAERGDRGSEQQL